MIGYAITDAQKTIWLCKDKSGAYSLTTNRSMAETFDTKILAEKVFKCNLSKLIKSKGVTVQAVELHVGGESAPEKNVVEEVVAPTSQTQSQYIVSILSDAATKLNDRHTVLSDELSKYDRQCSDIEHYIEFNAGKLNACDGYKAYKLLQDVLVQRRKVKDELEILQVVKDKMAIPDDMANITARLQTLAARRYEPRELKWLFEPKEKNNRT